MRANILDASAVLAWLFEEAGAENVEAALPDGRLCAVNLAGVIAKLIDRGATADEAEQRASALTCQTIDLDRSLALRAGALRASTRQHGLSLGDRACLALAQREGLPVLTADRAWAALDLGVEVVLIR